MHDFTNDPSQFKVLAVLGKSTLLRTDVFCSQYLPDGRLVALKCTDVDSCPTDLLALLQREVRMSRVLCHPNICTYSSSFLHKSKLCVIMPLMEYGSCADIMAASFKYGLPEQVVAVILLEVLHALVYIHDMHLIHRGIKGSHILLSKNGDIKLTGHRNMIELISDGVQVSRVHDFPKHDTSLLPWLSPDILRQNMQGYDTKSDIYSLGITACELANGHAPFIDMPITQMLLEKLNGTIPYLLDDSTVAPPPDTVDDENFTAELNHEVTRLSMIKMASSRRFSPMLHQFAKECLEKEPEDRPSARDLLKHPIFRQVKHKTRSEILQPIFAELTPFGSQTQDTQEVINLTDGLGEMSVHDMEWDFADN